MNSFLEKINNALKAYLIKKIEKERAKLATLKEVEAQHNLKRENASTPKH